MERFRRLADGTRLSVGGRRAGALPVPRPRRDAARPAIVVSAEPDRLIVVHVPDLDDEVEAFTAVAEEALAFLATADDAVAPLPPIFAGSGVDALARLRAAIRVAPPLRLYAPDARYEHEPIRVVEIDPGDLAAVGELVAELRRVAFESRYRGDIDEYLHDFVAGFPTAELDSRQLLELVARFHRVLDLHWSAKDETVSHALRRAAASLTPAVLSEHEEACYRKRRLFRDAS